MCPSLLSFNVCFRRAALTAASSELPGCFLFPLSKALEAARIGCLDFLLVYCDSWFFAVFVHIGIADISATNLSLCFHHVNVLSFLL